MKRNGELSHEDQDLERSFFNVALHPRRTLVSGCEKKNAGAVAALSLEETRAIAEEGFI